MADQYISKLLDESSQKFVLWLWPEAETSWESLKIEISLALGQRHWAASGNQIHKPQPIILTYLYKLTSKLTKR